MRARASSSYFMGGKIDKKDTILLSTFPKNTTITLLTSSRPCKSARHSSAYSDIHSADKLSYPECSKNHGAIRTSKPPYMTSVLTENF